MEPQIILIIVIIAAGVFLCAACYGFERGKKVYKHCALCKSDKYPRHNRPAGILNGAAWACEDIDGCQARRKNDA